MARKIKEKFISLQLVTPGAKNEARLIKWDDAVFAMAQADCRHDTPGGCRNCYGNEACGLCLYDEGYIPRAERMLKALFKGAK